MNGNKILGGAALAILPFTGVLAGGHATVERGMPDVNLKITI